MLDPGQQLLEGKGLGDVVSGAEVETLDPIGDIGSRSQHDHRQRRLGLPDCREHLDPIAARKHLVKDDEIGLGVERKPLARDAVGGKHDLVTVRLKSAQEEVGDPCLILDDQDLHLADATPRRSGRPAALRRLSSSSRGQASSL